jgi:hypothetical protein
MRKLITTKFNFTFEDYGEINTMPSATILEDTMSLKEMLNRYARGLPLPESRHTPYYNPDHILPNIHALDLVDQQNLKENAILRTEELSNQLQDEIKASKKANAPKEPKPPVPPVPPAEPPTPPKD